MKPAGFDNSQGIITAAYLKELHRQAMGQRSRDEAVARLDGQVDARRQSADWECGTGDLQPGGQFCYIEEVRRYARTRANLMRQAANHQKLRVPLLLPGITVSTSPTDFYPVQAVPVKRFKG